MQDVIRDLIQTESEASRLIEAAHQEAERLVAAAQKRAEVILAQAQTESHVQAEKLIGSALEQARAKRAEVLEKAALEMQTRWQLQPLVRDEIVDAVVRSIWGAADQKPAA